MKYRRKALIVGHFSTFGDLICLEIVKDKLKEFNIEFEIFTFDKQAREHIGHYKNFDEVNPKLFSFFIVCCGPYDMDMFTRKGILLSEFSHCKRFVFNTTMIDKISTWSPFQYLIERDSDLNVRVESAFLYESKYENYVSTCFIEDQGEHIGQSHKVVIDKVNSFLKRNSILSVSVDTKYPKINNCAGFDNVDQFLAVTSKSKFLITNRLHGTIFGLLSGVPVIAIDGIKGGGKVSKQCNRIGLPCIKVEDLNDQSIEKAVKWANSIKAIEEVKSIVLKSKLDAKENIELFSEFILGKNESGLNIYSENYGNQKLNKQIKLFSFFRSFLSAIKQTIIIWLKFINPKSNLFEK